MQLALVDAQAGEQALQVGRGDGGVDRERRVGEARPRIRIAPVRLDVGGAVEEPVQQRHPQPGRCVLAARARRPRPGARGGDVGDVGAEAHQLLDGQIPRLAQPAQLRDRRDHPGVQPVARAGLLQPAAHQVELAGAPAGSPPQADEAVQPVQRGQGEAADAFDVVLDAVGVALLRPDGDRGAVADESRIEQVAEFVAVDPDRRQQVGDGDGIRAAGEVDPVEPAETGETRVRRRDQPVVLRRELEAEACERRARRAARLREVGERAVEVTDVGGQLGEGQGERLREAVHLRAQLLAVDARPQRRPVRQVGESDVAGDRVLEDLVHDHEVRDLLAGVLARQLQPVPQVRAAGPEHQVVGLAAAEDRLRHHLVDEPHQVDEVGGRAEHGPAVGAVAEALGAEEVLVAGQFFEEVGDVGGHVAHREVGEAAGSDVDDRARAGGGGDRDSARLVDQPGEPLGTDPDQLRQLVRVGTGDRGGRSQPRVDDGLRRREVLGDGERALIAAAEREQPLPVGLGGALRERQLHRVGAAGKEVEVERRGIRGEELVGLADPAVRLGDALGDRARVVEDRADAEPAVAPVQRRRLLPGGVGVERRREVAGERARAEALVDLRAQEARVGVLAQAADRNGAAGDDPFPPRLRRQRRQRHRVFRLVRERPHQLLALVEQVVEGDGRARGARRRGGQLPRVDERAQVGLGHGCERAELAERCRRLGGQADDVGEPVDPGARQLGPEVGHRADGLVDADHFGDRRGRARHERRELLPQRRVLGERVLPDRGAERIGGDLRHGPGEVGRQGEDAQVADGLAQLLRPGDQPRDRRRQALVEHRRQLRGQLRLRVRELPVTQPGARVEPQQLGIRQWHVQLPFCAAT